MQNQIHYSRKNRPVIRLLPDTLYIAHLIHFIFSCTTHCIAVRFSVQYSSCSTVSVAPKCAQMNAFDAFQTDPEMRTIMQEIAMAPVADDCRGALRTPEPAHGPG